MLDGTHLTRDAEALRDKHVALRASKNDALDRIKAGSDDFSEIVDALRAVDTMPDAHAGAPQRFGLFKRLIAALRSSTRAATVATPTATPTPKRAPKRKVKRTGWHAPAMGAAPRGILRGGAVLLKSTAAVIVMLAIPAGAFATYHHAEIETLVSMAKQGWDCAQTRIITAQDGAGYYVQPVLSPANCTDAAGNSMRHVVTAPFRTDDELHAHIQKVRTLEGRYAAHETLFGFDVIGAFGAVYRALRHGGNGFSSPILTAFEVQTGKRSFSGDYVGKAISILAAMRFTDRYLSDPEMRERFISDGTPFVLDGAEYAGALGQMVLFGASGDDLTLDRQCGTVASIKRQLRPGVASDPTRAAWALRTHVGPRFRACVAAHSETPQQRETALAAGRDICGGSALCQDLALHETIDKRIQLELLTTQVSTLAPTWGGDSTQLEGLATPLRDSTRLANMEGGAFLMGTFQTDVQRAVRAVSVATRDKVSKRTGFKPRVTTVVAEVTTPIARVLGVSSGMSTGGLLPPPYYDPAIQRWIESDTLEISGGSTNKAQSTLVAYNQGRSTLCDRTQTQSCKSITAVYSESENEPYEAFNEQNEAEVRKLRDAIGYRAPDLAGQRVFGAGKDFIHGAVERLPVSQMIGFYAALLHGRFDGLMLIDGTVQGTPFDLDAMGYSPDARARTIKAGEATFHGMGTLSGDRDRMTAPGCTASAKTGTYNAGDALYEKVSIVLHQCGARSFVTYALIKSPSGAAFETGTVTSDDTHALHKAGLIAALRTPSTQP